MADLIAYATVLLVASLAVLAVAATIVSLALRVAGL